MILHMTNLGWAQMGGFSAGLCWSQMGSLMNLFGRTRTTYDSMWYLILQKVNFGFLYDVSYTEIVN